MAKKTSKRKQEKYKENFNISLENKKLKAIKHEVHLGKARLRKERNTKQKSNEFKIVLNLLGLQRGCKYSFQNQVEENINALKEKRSANKLDAYNSQQQIIVDMYRDGKSIEDIKVVLKDMNKNINWVQYKTRLI